MANRHNAPRETGDIDSNADTDAEHVEVARDLIPPRRPRPRSVTRRLRSHPPTPSANRHGAGFAYM
jgi:hypothetical protein